MKKKLYRSRDHRVVSGVMGGLGEYFSLDPLILRIVLILVILVTGIFPGVIAYIIAAFMVPEEAPFTPSVSVTDDDITL